VAAPLNCPVCGPFSASPGFAPLRETRTTPDWLACGSGPGDRPGRSDQASHAEPKSPAAASPPAAQGGKDGNPLIAFARKLGAPAWLLPSGGVVRAMFLLGEPFQKNLKAWRESLGLKPEPPSKGSPAPEPMPPARGVSIAGQAVSGNDNQSHQQTSAGEI
jgi:hypothetical protein